MEVESKSDGVSTTSASPSEGNAEVKTNSEVHAKSGGERHFPKKKGGGAKKPQQQSKKKKKAFPNEVAFQRLHYLQHVAVKLSGQDGCLPLVRYLNYQTEQIAEKKVLRV